MKAIPSLLLSSLCLVLTNPVLAAPEPNEIKGCLAKQQSIRQQIEQASAHKNEVQRAGLQKALDASLANCTDVSLRTERANKVLSARNEMNERELDLQKAMKKGDPAKIDKRNAKLAESRKELQQILDDLEG